MPILSPVLRVIGIGVIINSLCVVQSAQFSIRLDFKTPAKIAVSTQLASGFIGITLAYFGWGVWALVFQQVVSGIFYAIIVWFVAGWRPTMEFSKESFKYLWGYGSKILGASIIQQVYDNLYPLVIGKFYNANQLGLYSRAQGFASLPSTNFSGVVGSVTFPILSKVSDDLPRLTDIYRRMIKTTAFVIFPLMIALAALASPLIHILLNEQWYGCIVLLQILCMALIWQPLSHIHLSVLKVAKRTDIVFKLEIFKRGIGLGSLFCSVPFGVKGMCVSFCIWYVYCFTLNTIYTSKTLQVSFWGQIKDIFPILVNSIIMGFLIFLVSSLFINSYIQLSVGVIIGGVWYLCISKLFMKERLTDAVSMFKRK